MIWVHYLATRGTERYHALVLGPSEANRRAWTLCSQWLDAGSLTAGDSRAMPAPVCQICRAKAKRAGYDVPHTMRRPREMQR